VLLPSETEGDDFEYSVNCRRRGNPQIERHRDISMNNNKPLKIDGSQIW